MLISAVCLVAAVTVSLSAGEGFAWDAVIRFLGILMAGAAIVAVATWPVVGVFLLLVLLTIGAGGGTSISGLEIFEAGLLVMTVAGSLVRNLVHKDGAWLRSPFMPAAMLFAGTILFSALPALANGVPLSFWARRAFPFLLFFVFPVVDDACMRDKRLTRAIIGFLIVLGAVKNLPVLAHWYANARVLAGVENVQELRQAGTGVWLMSFPILAYAVAASTTSKLLRSILEILMTMSLAALAVSYTRSYWLGTAVAACVFLVLGLNVSRTEVGRVLQHEAGWIACFVVTAFAVAGSVTKKLVVWLLQRLASLGSGLETTSVQDRLYEARRLSSLFLESPIVGHGLGATYSFFSPTPFSWGLSAGYKTIFYSHNFYLYHLYATGVVGLAGFLCFFICVIARCVHALHRIRDRRSAMLLIATVSLIAAACVASLTSSEFSEKLPDLFLGILIGLSSCFIRITEQEKMEAASP